MSLTKQPLAQAVSNHARTVGTAALATVGAVAIPNAPAFAQEGYGLEEIVITARKREESLQDAPVAIQALGNTQLQQLGIQNFDDYAMMLPNLSYASAGPGLAMLYMRGASDGGDGNASGAQSSVAVYLDEQPVTSIGRNLDVHIYDVARVEALAGPQGTLYGANSQGGALRIITNKPNTEEVEGGIDIGVGATANSDELSSSFEAFYNQPLTDNAAIRLVAWSKRDGGYIDNVYGEKDYYIYNDTDGRTTVNENNSALVEEDFNDLKNTGARAALKVDLNDNWTVTGSYMTQKQETEGTWFHDPERDMVGDLEIQRYNDDSSVDEFDQFALVVEGDLGFATLQYAGSMLDRDVEYNNDYSAYSSHSNGWLYYGTCEYAYYSSGAPVTEQCYSQNIYYEDQNKYKRDSHELRLQSNGDGPLQYIVGYYYEDASHAYRQEWIQPGMANGPDFELLDKPDLWYLTDQVRSEKQSAFFGEISYDITDKLTVLGGARFFTTESALKGVTGYGTYVLDTVWGYPRLDVDEQSDADDSIYKFNVAYDLTDDASIYYTWSEGYRPGGINRAIGMDGNGNVTAPQIYKPDFLTNNELGWKTVWADNRVRWNGAFYHMQWEDLQFTQYDAATYNSPVGLTTNAAQALIRGYETDIDMQITEAFRLGVSASYNDAVLDENFALASNESLKGSPLPNVPKFKYNISARYDTTVNQYDMHWQAVYAHVDSRVNNIWANLARKLDSYDNLNLSAGIAKDQWAIEAYLNNVMDERAQISRGNSWDTTITTNRPRHGGVRLSVRF